MAASLFRCAGAVSLIVMAPDAARSPDTSTRPRPSVTFACRAGLALDGRGAGHGRDEDSARR